MSSTQAGLFRSQDNINRNTKLQPSGIAYQSHFLSKDEHALLVQFIESQPWLDDLKRRVQHYGYKYNYKYRKIDSSLKLGDLPKPFAKLAQRLYDEGHFPEVPDQAIVNEYTPGKGIAKHVDCEPCFGDVIASISLLSTVEMKFRHLETNDIYTRLLKPGSLVVLSGDARYKWTHEIPARKSDKNKYGNTTLRSRRISITFRKVIIE